LRVEELIWLPPVVEKIKRKHQVTPAEVEEVFFEDAPTFRKSGGVVYAFGQTHAGRYLFIVFEHLAHGRARVITARQMDNKEKRHYKKRRDLR
jgi:uncharacterized DUF497 family protein